MLKRKSQNASAFFLLELMLCVGAVLMLSMIIVSAQTQAVHYFLRARTLHAAVDLARQTLDQELCSAKKPMREQQIGTYHIAISGNESDCRVTVSWYNIQRQTISLSARRSVSPKKTMA